MPFIKVDPVKEKKEFEKLLKDPEAKKAYDEFQREYNFRIKLAQARKAQNITQKEIHEITGLPQQSISRIEKFASQKQSPTLKTLLRYVDALGYELTLSQKQQ
jgi:DNA-binding XRE family transcriptional regulator